MRSVVIEGLVIGLLASVLGLFAGLGLAKLLSAIGGDLPEAGLVFSLRTVTVSLALGTVITLLASITTTSGSAIGCPSRPPQAPSAPSSSAACTTRRRSTRCSARSRSAGRRSTPCSRSRRTGSPSSTPARRPTWR
jgi:hypothetical protein